MSDTTDTGTGRAPNGQFAQGNAGGPGNPFARQTALIRKAAADAATPEKAAQVMEAMHQEAIKGNVAAAKVWLAYSAGPPAKVPTDPDRLDRDELEARRACRASAADLEWMKGMPCGLACSLAQATAPAVAEGFRAFMLDALRDKPAEQEEEEAPGLESLFPIPGLEQEALRAEVEAIRAKGAAKKAAVKDDQRPAPMSNGREPSANG
ncbi:MAG: hypothetical protein K2W96_03225, partial [Gemmataceae bacterium]|nr:hypothetical protein [Gemmataceae bacterium]